MSNAEKGLPLFLALDALPEAYVTEAELPEKPDKKPSLWERINTNGWIAAAIGLVVALGVVTLIVLAGRGAGGPGVAGTSAPVIPEDAPYVFAFEDQVAVPIEGMWWYSGKTADGAYVDADGFGLSPNLLTMDDPPTIVLRAEDAARLQFICRTGEVPGEVNLWDADGEYLSNGHDFSFLTDALRGKTGIYYVTVNIARKTDAGSGEYTEGIRLIVGAAENDTAPIQTEDEPYVFVYRDQTAKPLEGLLWATDGTTSASGDGLPDAVVNYSDQSILPTIRADAEDVSALQFLIRNGHTPGTVRLYTIDGSRILASGSDFSFLPAYLAQQPDGGTGAYFLTVEVPYNDGTYSGCMTEGIRLAIGKDAPLQKADVRIGDKVIQPYTDYSWFCDASSGMIEQLQTLATESLYEEGYLPVLSIGSREPILMHVEGLEVKSVRVFDVSGTQSGNSADFSCVYDVAQGHPGTYCVEINCIDDRYMGDSAGLRCAFVLDVRNDDAVTGQ